MYDGRDAILLRYIGGAERSSGDSMATLEYLCCVGYLDALRHPSKEMYRTTDIGLIYLLMHGHNVDAPEVVNGRIIR